VTKKILLSSKNYPDGLWVNLNELNQSTFYTEISKLFGDDDSNFFVEDFQNIYIPFEFRHPNVGDQIFTDRFWDWLGYSTENQKLLVKYMEISCDDNATLEEAQNYFNLIGNKFENLSVKDNRTLFRYIIETNNGNCTLEEAKNYFII